MKNTIVVTLLVLISVISQAQSKHELAVGKATEALRKAMIDPDKSSLESLVSDDLSYGHSSGLIENKTEFIDKLVSGKSDFVSIDLSEQSVAVSGKTALVRHILKAKTNDGGRAGDVNIRILLVWQKKGGKWKLLARQAVRM